MPIGHAYTLEPGHPTPGWLNLLRPPIAFQVGAGILTRFPSTTALALILGADSPCADERGAGNLGLTASRPFTCFIATHVSIRTSDTSSRGHPPPSQAYGTLSYHPSAPFNALASLASAPLTVTRAASTLGGALCGSHNALHTSSPRGARRVHSVGIGLRARCASSTSVRFGAR